MGLGADLYSTFGDDACGPAHAAMGSGVLPREKLEILYAKPFILGNICAIIGPQKWPILLR